MVRSSIKKILIILDATQPGGCSKYTFNLAMVAKEKFGNVMVLLDVNSELDELFILLSRYGITTIRDKIYHAHYCENGIRSCISSILFNYRPNVVHVVCGSVRSAIAIRLEVLCKRYKLFFQKRVLMSIKNLQMNN